MAVRSSDLPGGALFILTSVAGGTGIAISCSALGHSVLIFGNTRILFLKVLLSVGVYALRDLLGLVGEQPALMLIEGIMEGIFYPLALFKGVHTRSDAASCSADGKIARGQQQKQDEFGR